jgi:hypothetical protein
MIRQFKIIAPDAIERPAHHAIPSLLFNYPWSVDKGRVMAHVLRMAATENSDGIPIAPQSKVDNWSFHIEIETVK